MINVNFLTGLPRAGNTLLSSVLNQNPNVKVSAYSVLPLLINQILDVKNNNRFKNFPDFEGIDNIIKKLFENYYTHYKCNNIIDRGAWGYHLDALKHMPVNNKFIVLYRPILEVLTSFVKIDKPKNVMKYCDELLLTETILSDALHSIQQVVDNKKEYILITYNDLISDISLSVKKTCEFIDIPYVEPDLKNIRQLTINNVEYNDTVLRANYHTIRTEEIKKNENKIKDYLPQEVIQKYKNFDVRF